MEYELADDIPDDRCALVARRDGGLDTAPFLFGNPAIPASTDPRGYPRAPEPSPQMGE